MEAAIEAGADDVEEELDDINNMHIDVYCPLTESNRVRAALRLKLSQLGDGLESDLAASSTYAVNTPTNLDEQQYEGVMQLVEELEEIEDVQRVFHNAALSEQS
eukprot:c13508_g1_i3.p2 GENE.c13508_g1_i3~~c13508_g1_i3.p2  ORF type:complete len:104 (+),score=40.00 c13508_g1_i3:679-990(+)